jgi:hypothetical protein
MHKTSLIITVDAEFSTHKEDFGIFGNISGENYGLDRFIELLGKYNIKATFFVDVYSVRTEYRDNLIKICKKLAQADHDLQLHTHPNGMFDNKRGCMKEYSLDEQVEIIARGKEIFKEWFGIIPMAHRAGDWGADNNTLVALKRNNFLADCSMFHKWPQCGLNSSLFTKNKVVDSGGILEIPATVFSCVGMGLFSPFRLLSTDGNAYAEVNHILNKMIQAGIPLVTSVYHSFSFLKYNSKRTKYTPHNNRLRKFELFLKRIASDNQIATKTIRQICEDSPENKAYLFNGPDSVFSTGLGASLLRIIDRIA